MKTIVRNFLSMVRRFKMAAVLNVAGLAVAFAVFSVILIQIRYEAQFDRCHPTADRVFRVQLTTTGTFSVILPRAFVEAVLQSSPHIEAGSLINPYISPIYFTVTENGEKQGFRETVQTCHPALVQTFGFPILEGNAACLKEPEKVIIPESLARKLFGDQSAVGKPLHAEEMIWSKERADFTVGAVYRDFPENTQLRNVIYTAMDPDFALTNFRASNYICYVLLDDAAAAQDVVDNFNRNFDFKNIGSTDAKLMLTPLTDIYYLNESQDGTLFRSGNRESTYLLLCIGVLILLVAGINFTNFSTALTPLRIKSINIQKVLGSSDRMLRLSLLVEAMLICLAAWVGSLFLVWAYGDAHLGFLEADVSLLPNVGVLALSGGVALIVGALAGAYPAMYITSFPPALVLKGSFGLSASGRRLRTVLIGIQFVVSILLIIGATFVWMQNGYMRSYALGFDKDQIAIVELNGDMASKHGEAYASRLKQYPGIENVAFAMQKLGAQDGYSTNGGAFKGETFHYFMLVVSWNFLETMGIPLTDGRGFTPSDASDFSDMNFIINREMQSATNMKVGDRFDGTERRISVIGAVGDIQLTSLRQNIYNMAFVVSDTTYSLPVSYIRLKAGTDLQGAVNHIRRTLADIDPNYPFDIEFYDDIFNQLYQKEESLRTLVTAFSLIAILLSLVGVFGLVVFETQYRRKEIGIRKIHGATVAEVLAMFNKSYFRIIAVCFVLAAPVAWYGVKVWLENFAYKVPMSVWVFCLAFVVVAGITLGTVTFQSWRAANANPADSIKNE
ncbi:MAG: FtsX-like permease family protein [Tannerellaceae bacterium]